MQGKASVYDVDLFIPLLEGISRLVGKKYGSDSEADNAMRIIAEHGRGITFLISDGVIPANDGRGYVLRRLLRRAALFSRRLGLDKPFLLETAKTTIEQMKHIYSEIEQRRDFIIKVIELEEARFRETLSTGLELLDSIMAKATGKGRNRVSGKEAFKLYDTHGFPIELTGEIAAERGFPVDLEGFEKEMEKQRERAREAQKFGMVQPGTEGMPDLLDIGATPFVGYQSLECKSVIVSLMVNSEPAESIQEGQEASLILEATPFYGEMGGAAR
ncbi:alanine--tRNA ligase-related protein, partial [Chloroflexota bacterium]